MGQYFYIINEDKKEYIYPHQMGSGLKFYEILKSKLPQALAYLLFRSTDPSSAEQTGNLLGKWAGNRISIVGDYDESGLYEIANKEYTNISLKLREELESLEREKDLWEFGERWDKP